MASPLVPHPPPRPSTCLTSTTPTATAPAYRPQTAPLPPLPPATTIASGAHQLRVARLLMGLGGIGRLAQDTPHRRPSPLSHPGSPPTASPPLAAATAAEMDALPLPPPPPDLPLGAAGGRAGALLRSPSPRSPSPAAGRRSVSPAAGRRGDRWPASVPGSDNPLYWPRPLPPRGALASMFASTQRHIDRCRSAAAAAAAASGSPAMTGATGPASPLGQQQAGPDQQAGGTMMVPDDTALSPRHFLSEHFKISWCSWLSREFNTLKRTPRSGPPRPRLQPPTTAPGALRTSGVTATSATTSPRRWTSPGRPLNLSQLIHSTPPPPGRSAREAPGQRTARTARPRPTAAALTTARTSLPTFRPSPPRRRTPSPRPASRARARAPSPAALRQAGRTRVCQMDPATGQLVDVPPDQLAAALARAGLAPPACGSVDFGRGVVLVDEWGRPLEGVVLMDGDTQPATLRSSLPKFLWAKRTPARHPAADDGAVGRSWVGATLRLIRSQSTPRRGARILCGEADPLALDRCPVW
ncbi:hypothetical protein PAPYR_8228 [Paratrimastix pyriformis]|uniref:Uncharacterized protein n=1 Tax=Paratrimastix pyriformis TaxID=342808 RepID=A0ABQ8UFN1_9EUKA|nr:hypothetical protein PAPYR_8228 [Paratrimastix pyriformis]